MQFEATFECFYKTDGTPIVRTLVVQRELACGVIFVRIGGLKQRVIALDERQVRFLNPKIIRELDQAVLERVRGRLRPIEYTGQTQYIRRLALRTICEPFGDQGVGSYKHLTGQLSLSPLADAIKQQRVLERAKSDERKAKHYAEDELAGAF